jgi:hypothetical protein
MDPAGTVRVGLRSVEFRTLVREILPDPAPGKISVMNEQGKVMQTADFTWVAAKPGDRMLFVVGTSNSRNWESLGIVNSIATRNLTSGESEVSKRAIAALAVPPLNTFFGIISIFVALFSLLGLAFGSAQGIVFLIPSVGYLLWVRARIKKVRRAVQAILVRAGAPAPA